MMQHIASQEALSASTERLLEIAGGLDDEALGGLGSDLQAVSQLLDRQPGLRRTLSEATTPVDGRAQLIGNLLRGHIGEPAAAAVQTAIRQPWANGSDLREGIGRLGRTATFLRAERSGELDDVEDQLFRFSRIVDGSPELSLALDDPTAAPEARAGLVRRLLTDRAAPLTVELLTGLAQHPGGRSYAHGVHELVEQAADRKDKLVGVVQSAAALTEGQVDRLRAALRRIYHRDLVLHVAVQPDLLGGLRIQVGDEVIDGSVAGRLDNLRRALAG
jgi:F-type H+-transporting ATPase subunit delta